jgi:hypothetical protein
MKEALGSSETSILIKHGVTSQKTPFFNHTKFERLEVFTAVIMKNGVFWDVTPRGSCKNRRFGGT